MTGYEDSLLVVTDLDGTLLDDTTYEFRAAREALNALRASAIPIVLATSKTLPEAREVAAAIGGHPILIVENGGAAVIPSAYALQSDEERLEDDALVIEMGVARERCHVSSPRLRLRLAPASEASISSPSRHSPISPACH